MSAPYAVRLEEGEEHEFTSEHQPLSRHNSQQSHRHAAVTYKDYASRVSHFPQCASPREAISPRRSAPIPERSVAVPVDMNSADPSDQGRQRQQCGSTQEEGGHLQLIQSAQANQLEHSETDERRDPPADWDYEAPRSQMLRIDIPSTSIHVVEGADVNPLPPQRVTEESLDRRDELEAQGLLRSPQKSPKQPTFRNSNHPLAISSSPTTTSPAQQDSSPSGTNRFPYIPSEDRLPPMSPAPSFTVNTEREGKKVMSQAEMSEMIRNSMIKAKQQAAASQPTGTPHPPRATVVEIQPSSLRSSFRMALKQQQPAGKTPQGPFPWSPILNANAAGTNSLLHQHHHLHHPNPDDLEMRSMAEWTEPSQLTEPSALLAMNDHIRYTGGLHGVVPKNLVLVNRGELYEEMEQSPKRKQATEVIAPKVPATAAALSEKRNSVEHVPSEAAANDRRNEPEATDAPGESANASTENLDADEEPTRKLSLPSFDRTKQESENVSMVPQAAQDTDPPVSASIEDVKHRKPSDSGDEISIVLEPIARAQTPNQSKEEVLVSSDGDASGTLAEELLRSDLPDTIESLRHLRHTLSPRSGAGAYDAKDRTSREEDNPSEKRTDPAEVSKGKVSDDDVTELPADAGTDERVPSPVESPPALDIMSDKDIDKLVSISMSKAQKTAKKEVRELFHDSRRRKDNIVLKTSEGDKVLSKTEVADLIKDSMARARETAQLEIAEMVKDSLRLARESAQEEIRLIVEESMRRARESTQREMQEFVKESFQKTRWSDASAVSVASSQGFTAADFTLSSFPGRQPSFGSSNIPVRSSQIGYNLDHLSPLSEEEHHLLQDTLEPSLKAPSLRGSDSLLKSVDRPAEAIGDIKPSDREVSVGPSDPDDSEHPKERSREPEGFGGIKEEEEVGSSLMVIKNCTSPDVFHGIDELELHARASRKDGEELTKGPRSDRRASTRGMLEPEEKRKEVHSCETNVATDVSCTRAEDAPTEPSGVNELPPTKRFGSDPFVSKEADEKAKLAVASISETLRGYDEQKQKRIEEAAYSLLAGTGARPRRSKDRRRRRGGSVTDSESIKKSVRRDGNWSDREGSSRPSSSKSHERSRASLSRRSDRPSGNIVARRPTKDSQHSGSDRSSRKSSRSKRSSSTGRSKSSVTKPCAAESVVTQEFLARLTTPKANLKELMTPKAQNLTKASDDGCESPEAHRPGIQRTGSKDSVVTVPGNKFCLQFLQYLVNGGVGDESVSESVVGCSAFPRSREVENPETSPAAVPAGGRMAALNPAAMFNKGSTWIDSLAEDMSSVLEGHDSTDIDTEGDTTFDDHDMSSYSQTDGEVEDDEEFVLSHDDNSYNAGWWTGQRRGRPSKGKVEAKPWKKRRDPGDSLLD
jgi:hypothetical protein